MSQLYLMSAQVIQAIQVLEGERLPLRTLSAWASRGVAPASLRHDRTRSRYHPRLYCTATDFLDSRVSVFTRPV